MNKNKTYPTISPPFDNMKKKKKYNNQKNIMREK